MAAFEVRRIGRAAGDPIDAKFPTALIQRLALLGHHHAENQSNFGAAGAMAAWIGRTSRDLGDVFRRLDILAVLEGAQLLVFLLDRADANAAVLLHLRDEFA